MRFNNRPAPLTLRANRLQTSRETLLQRFEVEDIDAHPAKFAPDGIVVDRGNLRAGAETGDFIVQDEASQLVALLAGPDPGPRVLDTCASPGGKATAIASTLRAGARLVACDVRERRITLLRRTVAAAGATNVWIVQADVTANPPFGVGFSSVMVDAPCSGLGTLRRDPDIKWRREPESLPALGSAQQAMLDRAATAVAPGGRLIYSTCSSEPEENEDVVAAFVASHPDFRPVRADLVHPVITPDLVDPAGYLRTEPDRHGLELFFGAVFERERQL
jgi:16S rRNA (cytosine967-C5)-methyltransferase